MADKVYISREVPGPASAPSGEGSSPQFGLTAAMALIVGSIIGVGFARDMVVAALSLVFSTLFIWCSRNTGHSFWVYWALFFLAGDALLGIPVYLGQRSPMSQPAPVPPYREVERGG